MAQLTGITAKTGGALMAAGLMSGAFQAEAQAQPREQIFDLSKSFNMEFQAHPYTDPVNSPMRQARVNCANLDVAPNGSYVMSPQFLSPFDMEPRYKPNPNNLPAVESHAMTVHIGSMTNEDHQICLGQSQMFAGNPKFLPTPFTFGNYKTSVPPTDDRYCAPYAAVKMCTRTTADDASLSKIWRIDPNTGDVTVNRSELTNIPPELSR